MGDIIHALPVAHDIRQALPEAELHWVAEESFRDIPTLAPAVSKVHVTAFRRWRKAILSGPVRAEMADVKNALRAEHYDVVLDIQGLMRSAMVARWAGVPATGYSWGTAREPIASLAYARKLDLPASLGAVRRYRMAAAEALGYEIDPERPVFGLQANAEPSVKPAGPYAALAVNTSRDEKLWPEEYWTHLGRKFAGAGLRSVLFWGSDVERERVERLVRTIPGAEVAPRTTLATTAATLARVRRGRRHGACPSRGGARSSERRHLRLHADRDPEACRGRSRAQPRRHRTVSGRRRGLEGARRRSGRTLVRITPSMYRAVSVVALPLASLYLMWRSRRQPAYRQFWDERFAWSSFPLKTGRPRVWIHAVSVGETNAAKPLLEAVLERWPECDVLLTHMTPTGREAGAKLVALAPDRIHQCYLPYDAPYAVEKFFRQTQPTIGIIMETEVWPNLMSEAKRCGVPMVLANARESEKSRAQAEKFLDVMGPAFGSFTAILAQSEEDKERLESLGGRNVTVCGSVKFDIRPNASQEAAARAWKASLSRPVALIASTRQGEEVLFAKAMATRPELLRRAQFWLVPRHPQRFDEVFRTLTGAGLKVCRRSQIAEPADVPADTDVVLGDSMGEMSFYCALADMTAMGGSFQNHGSQNVIEPALAGSPIVVGPSIFNFQKVIRDGLSAGAMVQVETPEEALDRFEHWLDVPETRVSASEAALGFSRQYAGATQRMMTILEVLWQKAQKTASLTS